MIVCHVLFIDDRGLMRGPASLQVCSILYEFRDCRAVLKQVGWEQAHFQRLARESEFSLDPELGSISQAYTSPQRRSSRKASHKDKSSRRSRAKRERNTASESTGQVRI